MAIAFIRKAFIILTAAVLFGANTVEARAQENIPDGVDNSKLIYFPPLISQIGGSCAQASYIGYMFTYEMNRLLNRNASESKDNQFSYLYTWNFINGGIDEGSLGTEGLQIAFEGGIATEADFPSQYSSYQFKWTSGYESYLKAIHYRVTKIRTFEVNDRAGIDEVRHYLWNRGEPGKPGGIVTFSSRSSGWTINTHYTGPSVTGYKALLTKLAPDGAHAMTIVGYDDLVEFTAPDGTVSGTDNVAPDIIPIDSIRRGEVPGIHSIIYDSDADNITITHDAHSRKGFALGAVLAAEYAANHEGFLTMHDLFPF